MRIREIRAKSIITKSRLPDVDYAVNPYIGCEFGCLYCYASFMCRLVKEPVSEWGRYVYVKVNAVELFEKELAAMPASERNSSMFFSSVTDCYQGAEAKYRLTRGMLEVLARERYPGEVGILTKSSLVLRDIDTIKRLQNSEVGMTVTTTEDSLSRFLEVGATLSSARISTLKKLHEAGIRTYAFVGPLLPHFRYKPELLDDLFAKLAEAGVGSIYVEHINLKSYIKDRLFDMLKNEPQQVRDAYAHAESEEHRRALDGIVSSLAKKHGLELREGEVLYHNRKPGGWASSWPS